jgi:hypothetical protein
MLSALAYLAGLAFNFTGARPSVSAYPEIPAEAEELPWEPTIEELYSDGGGDA